MVRDHTRSRRTPTALVLQHRPLRQLVGITLALRVPHQVKPPLAFIHQFPLTLLKYQRLHLIAVRIVVSPQCVHQLGLTESPLVHCIYQCEGLVQDPLVIGVCLRVRSLTAQLRQRLGLQQHDVRQPVDDPVRAVLVLRIQ